MKIFGQEVDPYDLFLILILLLAGTGFFTPPQDGENPNSKKGGGFPSFFEFLGNSRKKNQRKEVSKDGKKKAHKLRLGMAKTLPMGVK